MSLQCDNLSGELQDNGPLVLVDSVNWNNANALKSLMFFSISLIYFITVILKCRNSTVFCQYKKLSL